ncbi:MAG: type II secretion system F family protein [Planctomycetaceae bacterium]
MGTFFLSSLTFLVVSAVAYIAMRRFDETDNRADSRLSELPDEFGDSVARRALPRRRRASQAVGKKLLALATRLAPNDQKERSALQARLIHAGIYATWAPAAFLTVKLLLVALPPLFGLILGQAGLFNPHKALLWGSLLGGCGIIIPGMWLDRQKARRHAVFSRSLPDFLDLMVTCVQSGLSLEAALQRVTDELSLAHPVLAGEMAIVQRQIEFGATPDVALRNFAQRSDLTALFSLSTLIQQARRFGTTIGDALRTHAEMLRYQREQRAEEMAQKAAVKILFPTLLFIFPAIFVVLVGPAAVQLSEKFSAKSSSVTSHTR